MRSLIKAFKLNFFFKINSLFWLILLKFNNIEVGRNFYIEGVILLKIRGKNNLSFIKIGNNVNIFGNLDLRTREEGCITIGDNVSFDDDIRIVAARASKIIIEQGCEIGKSSMINAGANVTIEENTLIGSNCLIQASNHGTSKKGPIKGQVYNHSPIFIGKGSWLASNVVVLPGRKIEAGSVIGASTVVTKDTTPDSINVGNPLRDVGNRIK